MGGRDVASEGPVLTSLKDAAPLLTPVRLAHMKLGVSREWFYKMIKEKRIPSYRLGAKILVDMSEVLEAMRQK